MLDPDAFSVKSVLAKRSVCTHGRILRYLPVMERKPGKSNDWPKQTWKKYPIRVTQTATRAQLRDSPSEATPVPFYTFCTLFLWMCTLFHSLPSLWGFSSAKPKGALATTTQPSLQLGSQALLQALAGRGHPRSEFGDDSEQTGSGRNHHEASLKILSTWDHSEVNQQHYLITHTHTHTHTTQCLSGDGNFRKNTHSSPNQKVGLHFETLRRNSPTFKKSNCPAAKSLHSCPTLCDPIDGSPPGSPIPGILQARTLEWVAISFSNELPS